jgi:hypothetical protein
MITVPIRKIAMPTSDADWDILQLAANSSFRLALHMISLTSDAATEEFLDLALVRRSTSGTGTDITEVQDDQGNNRTPSITAKHTIATPGTLSSTGISWLWGQRSELIYIPTPECREVVSESGILCLHCATSLSQTKNLSGFFKLEEF